MKFSVSCPKCGTYRTSMRAVRCQYCYGPVLCWGPLKGHPVEAVRVMLAKPEREAAEA